MHPHAPLSTQQLADALANLQRHGLLSQFKGFALSDVMQAPLAAGLVRLHATLAAHGQRPFSHREWKQPATHQRPAIVRPEQPTGAMALAAKLRRPPLPLDAKRAAAGEGVAHQQDTESTATP